MHSRRLAGVGEEPGGRGSVRRIGNNSGMPCSPFLLPVVAAQAAWVRWRTEVLHPADGPVHGSAGTGSSRPLRLGLVGESTAAGVGVCRHRHGFPGRLAEAWSTRTGRRVEWRVSGRSGATVAEIRAELLAGLGDGLDLAVALVGVNDVIRRRTAEQWRQDLDGLVGDLGARAHRVVVAGVPPFEVFPALPRTLARCLADRAAVLDAVSRQVCAAHPRACWLPTTSPGPGGFARDGFHPSADGYRQWAEVVAAVLP